MSCLNRRPKISKTARELYFGNQTFNLEQNFLSNFISTSKYTIITFFPMALILQFKRYANVYFLITAILQSIPEISPLTPATAWAPLIFVLGLSIIREGIEDYGRHKSDKELNASVCTVYEDGKFKKIEWADIKVGSIILIEEQEAFPADIVILSSSLENGVCFLETSSLDGEKNLKPKMSPKETADKFQKDSENPIFRLEGKIDCEPPNPNIHGFSGSLTMRGNKIILNAKQLLLRGAVLKNTKWVIGIAVYTGLETKIMLNSNPSRFKQSQIERTTNKLILFIFSFQLICCLICAIGAGYFYHEHEYHDLFLNKIYSSGLEGVLNFFTYFLLVNTMIPISLIVSLEMVKMFQAFFIEKDVDLYDEEKNIYAKAFTTSINEELGMIQYIFSDKTGTLTCNKMEFKIALIGNEMYGDRRILNNKNSFYKKPTYVDKKEGISFSFEDIKLQNLLRTRGEINESQSEYGQNLMLKYEIFDKNGKKNYEIKTLYDLCVEYFKLLSTCHECVIDSEKNKEMNMIRYQGPSPDEITLVDTARHLGFIFLGSSNNALKVEWLGAVHKIEVLKIFEFNSDRKRMTVIIRDNNKIKLYCKGADSIIKSRLSETGPHPFLKEINHQLDEFSRRGLRTLLLSFKILSEEDYQEFDQNYNKLADNPNRDKEIDKLADELERGLFLLGATAVEDKLQDLVPETIHDFISANIKVWMLTGDKMETAENIGRSCNLIQNHFAVLKVSFRPEQGDSLKSKLLELLDMKKQYMEIKKPKGFIIEGEHLGLVQKDESLVDIFMEIVKDCEAVICCRVTPKQKADVVALVKKRLNKITLSIGDGANDVNMIQEAHIGIGLYGEEGMRAVQSSDFAFVKFRCLWRLLFVHGKWSYIRISEMILYFFYKNMVFSIIQFFYSFRCGWSGQTIYDDYYITFYNLVFTALPVIIRALIEQDIYYRFPVKINKEDIDYDEVKPYEENELVKKYFPKLYKIGQKNTLFTFTNFSAWVFQGMIHGLIIFLFCMYIFEYQLSGYDGYNTDLWIMSITMYTAIILVVDIKIAVHTQYWTLPYAFILIFTSVILYFAYIWISDQMSSFASYQTAEILFITANFYLTAIVCFGIVFATDILIVYIKVLSQKNLIESLKVGLRMGYDKSETFFRDLFKSNTNVISIAGKEIGNSPNFETNRIMKNSGDHQEIINLNN